MLYHVLLQYSIAVHTPGARLRPLRAAGAGLGPAGPRRRPVYIYTYIHICIYIYIYTYTYGWRHLSRGWSYVICCRFVCLLYSTCLSSSFSKPVFFLKTHCYSRPGAGRCIICLFLFVVFLVMFMLCRCLYQFALLLYIRWSWSSHSHW